MPGSRLNIGSRVRRNLLISRLKRWIVLMAYALPLVGVGAKGNREGRTAEAKEAGRWLERNEEAFPWG